MAKVKQNLMQDIRFAPSFENMDVESKSVIRSVLTSAKAPFLIADLVDEDSRGRSMEPIRRAVDLHVGATFARPEEDAVGQWSTEEIKGWTLHLVFYAIRRRNGVAN